MIFFAVSLYIKKLGQCVFMNWSAYNLKISAGK